MSKIDPELKKKLLKETQTPFLKQTSKGKNAVAKRFDNLLVRPST